MSEIHKTRADLVTAYGSGVTPPSLVEVSGWYSEGDGYGGMFEYMPALTVTTDPEGAPIVLDAQGRHWLCRELQPSLKLSVPRSGFGEGLGDSMMVGQAASNYANKGFFQTICNSLGLTPSNRALSGKGIFYSTNASFAYHAATTSKRGGALFICAGHNDGVYPSTHTAAKVYNELVSILANYFCATSVPFVSGSFTRTGLWFAGSGINEKSTSNILVTGNGGDLLTGSFTGDNVVVRTFTNDGTAGNRLRNIDFWVDDPGTYLPGNRAIAGFDGDCGYDNCPVDAGTHIGHATNIVFDVGSGSHTFALKAGAVSALGGTIVYADSLDTMRVPGLCDPVFMFAPPRPRSYTIGSGISTPAVFDAIDAALLRAIRLFTNEDYPVAFVRTNDFLNPLSISPTDLEHPLDAGHAQMKRALLAQVVS